MVQGGRKRARGCRRIGGSNGGRRRKKKQSSKLFDGQMQSAGELRGGKGDLAQKLRY
jgi:hypothetical protein